MAALGENLQPEEFHEELVHHLHARLKTARTSASARQLEAERNRSQAEAERKALEVKIKNVLAAIKEAGHSKALLAELHELDSKAERLDETLLARAASPPKEITEQEVRDFVRNSVDRFAEILAGAPEFVRGELQKRISSVTLTPSIDEHGPVFTVTGDVELFTRPEGVLQTNQLATLEQKF